jgi:hypothetical protein
VVAMAKKSKALKLKALIMDDKPKTKNKKQLPWSSQNKTKK